jgi:hypothetical protein
MNSLLAMLSLFYSFELGLTESGYVLWEKQGYTHELIENVMVETNFDIGLRFWRFYIGGGTATSSVPNERISYYNAQWNNYSMKAGYDGKYFNVGYEYRCIHPVMAYLQDKDIDSKKEGNYKKLFVTFKHELRFGK